MVSTETALKTAAIGGVITAVVAYVVDKYVWAAYSDTQSPYIVAVVMGIFITAYAYFGMKNG